MRRAPGDMKAVHWNGQVATQEHLYDDESAASLLAGQDIGGRAKTRGFVERVPGTADFRPITRERSDRILAMAIRKRRAEL